jgi:hypothetical protein
MRVARTSHKVRAGLQREAVSQLGAIQHAEDVCKRVAQTLVRNGRLLHMCLHTQQTSGTHWQGPSWMQGTGVAMHAQRRARMPAMHWQCWALAADQVAHLHALGHAIQQVRASLEERRDVAVADFDRILLSCHRPLALLRHVPQQQLHARMQA